MKGIEKRSWRATMAALVWFSPLAAFGQQEAAERATSHAKPLAERRVVVHIPRREVALVENGKVVKIYPAAVGAKISPSPAGTFKIVTRIPRPTYYKPGVVVPPGKSNPLGTRWLGLSIKGYGIHGTNSARSIGKAVSHGCIRLRNSDVDDLFQRIEVGDIVELYDRDNEELQLIFGPSESHNEVRSVAIPSQTGGQ